jgi:glycosyltransferase involved in cell wall biosynthesis
MPWAMSLLRASKVFFISQYAADAAQEAGVLSAEHIQIGVDTDSWRHRTKEDYKMARKSIFGVEDDTFIILTVADNQERKNLSGAMESISKMKEQMPEDFKFRWALVTRAGMGIGWNLLDLSITLNIVDNYVELERGVPFPKLWMLYAAADVFFLASKGEGLGLPALEAQAVGVPVIASSVGALTEHLSDGRGILIPAEYQMIDPYGNATRYYMDKEQATLALMNVAELREDLDGMVEKSLEYVKARTWDKPILQLDEAIRSLVDAKKPKEETSEPTAALV